MIPKNACSSVRQIIRKQIEGKDDIEYDLKKLKKLPKINYINIHRFQDYFWFAFLRNPFDRVISAYNDKVLGKQGDEIYKALYNPGMSFTDFITYISITSDEYIDWHLKSQNYYIGRYLKNMNYIGMVENFKKNIEEIKKKINNNYTVDHLRKTAPFDRVKYFQNPKLKKIIKTRYKRDFELIEKYE